MQHGAQLREIELAGIFRREPRRHAFERLPRIVDFEKLLLRKDFHCQRIAGTDHDEIFRLQLAQRFTHWGLADAEFLGEIVSAQPRPGRQDIAEKRFTQDRISDFGCRAGIGETLGESRKTGGRCGGLRFASGSSRARSGSHVLLIPARQCAGVLGRHRYMPV